MEFEHLLKLIEAVSDSKLTQFSYEENGVSVKMKTDREQKLVTVNGAAANTQPMACSTESVQADREQQTQQEEGKVVKSPLVGTFYASPTPDSEDFVKVGDTVKKGQVLGIVEAMKLMNEIESDYDGVVKSILVTNEQVIEFGQSMFIIG